MASSTLSLPISLLSYLAIFTPVVAADGPIAATWSSTMFGPDGPWPAVEVTMGSEQKIAMYPGREFQSFVLTSDYCNQNSTIPCSGLSSGRTTESRPQMLLDQPFPRRQPGSWTLEMATAAATAATAPGPGTTA